MWLNILCLVLVRKQGKRTRVAKLRTLVAAKLCCDGIANSPYAYCNEIHTKAAFFPSHSSFPHKV